ncbi:hypothetical protein C0966_16945 (plasmid) [Bacillus methanolicus]|uniref:hypothetical protein n=1 Tax=Bacillus methanolicus TaxID=1471 RepID=UPI0023808165|nr:hypothetical protein [Bacillus methanolicus]MDE3840954.1 hypothetical protein [Bacillus methanolicus]
MKIYKFGEQTRVPHEITKTVIEVSEAELQLIQAIRELDNPDELVRISSSIDSERIKNCLLYVAAEKILLGGNFNETN